MRKFIRFNRLVAFFISVGFLVLAFEIYLQHYDQLSSKKAMWIPIVFGTVGGFLGIFITLIFNRVTYYLFLVLMVFSILVGMLGLYFHNRWRMPAFIDFLFRSKPFNFEILTTYSPLLAPSAFMAIGALGILIVIYHGWGES